MQEIYVKKIPKLGDKIDPWFNVQVHVCLQKNTYTFSTAINFTWSKLIFVILSEGSENSDKKIQFQKIYICISKYLKLDNMYHQCLHTVDSLFHQSSKTSWKKIKILIISILLVYIYKYDVYCCYHTSSQNVNYYLYFSTIGRKLWLYWPFRDVLSPIFYLQEQSC